MVFGKHINKYYVRYGGILLLGVLALLVVDYMQLEIPKMYRMVVNGLNEGFVVVDGVTRTFDMDFLLDEICKPMLIVIVSLVLGRFLWRICFFGTAIKVEKNLRSEMFSHAKDLSLAFYQTNKVGHLMSLFTNDLETMQDCFGSGVLMLFDALLLGGLAVYNMAVMDVRLTLFSLIPMAFMLAIGLVMGKYMMKKWDERQEAFSRMSDFAQENFSGIAVIKAFVKEFKELLAFRKLNVENEKANVEFTKASTLLNILVTLFVESVVCVILGYGGYLVYKGVFNAGELMEFIGYFNAIVWPVMAVSQLIEMSSRGKTSLKRVSDLLDAKSDVTDRPGVKDLKKVDGNIEYRHLSFSYPGSEREVLENVSFKVAAGENVGIVGKTGAGKTTIVDLLLRTYNVPDGTLFVDGEDVNEVSIKSLRDHIAYVPQDNFLFSDTVKNNIAFGVNEASDEAVAAAAKLAGVSGDIEEFKDGYATIMGERGVTVSGGQKQRISIARALLKNAEILILDDSVSAVDTATEKEILQNLRETRAGKTTFIIAHRVSTLEHLDKLVYVDDGRIVDVGTHKELYDRCAEYRNMVELQRLEEERKEEER